METRYEHIVFNEDRAPTIAGTTMKLVELVVKQQAYGWSTEELHFRHPYSTLDRFMRRSRTVGIVAKSLTAIFNGEGCATRRILRRWLHG